VRTQQASGWGRYTTVIDDINQRRLSRRRGCRGSRAWRPNVLFWAEVAGRGEGLERLWRSRKVSVSHLHLEAHCCRWLLIAHDNALSDTFPLTQEFLTMMLGIQRAGVSIAASFLQKADRPSARHFRPARVARHRRRGDRKKLAMSRFRSILPICLVVFLAASSRS